MLKDLIRFITIPKSVKEEGKDFRMRIHCNGMNIIFIKTTTILSKQPIWEDCTEIKVVNQTCIVIRIVFIIDSTEKLIEWIVNSEWIHCLLFLLFLSVCNEDRKHIGYEIEETQWVLFLTINHQENQYMSNRRFD